MSYIQETGLINAPIEKVWDVIKDFGGIHKIHPTIKSSPLVEGKQPKGLGAERVTNWNDGQGYEVEFRNFGIVDIGHAEINLEPHQSKTELTFTIRYTTKFGPLGAVVGKLMMKPMMKSILRKFFINLNKHMETGKFIGKNGKLLGRPHLVST